MYNGSKEVIQQMETINERFRKVRGSLKLSQEDFASAANRTRSEIKNIEYGKTSPKEEVIVSICKAHNINPVWLRTGVGEPFVPVSREDEITAVLSKAMLGNSSARDRIIRALAHLPEDAFPLIEQYLLQLAAELGEDNDADRKKEATE